MKSYLQVRVESHRFSTGDLIGGDAALDFVRTRHHAVLGTLKGDGTPQLSPVTVGVDADGHR